MTLKERQREVAKMVCPTGLLRAVKMFAVDGCCNVPQYLLVVWSKPDKEKSDTYMFLGN